ncbi:TlpA disulfide reductase family protein [Tenacibaculum maritimum]|uniref:TlpA family protein disulfide reductase n=1 Tax=Tenacibaculum maritimum TaxID=107401 RepID=UPI002306EC1B|nr:TlpA disulfide reductase family protein [Tenacibaculum maritimum]MDB0601306.1 TlpA disulfide reductase family protein [Tenacibaculum maritimum]MDB0611728.1 TlpA disulfide reductase family protein [Tenacibaculum maritimum]
MKKLVFASFIALLLASCKGDPKDYTTFSGKIENKNSNSLTVMNPKTGYKKVITVNEDGTFIDTLKIKDGAYPIFDGKEYTVVYFKKGADIKVSLDAKKLDQTISFTGEGAEESKFLVKSTALEMRLFTDPTIFELPKKDFDAKIKTFVADFDQRIEKENFKDADFVAEQRSNIENVRKEMEQIYAEKAYINEKLAKGVASPKFVNYENNNGKTTSLDDLKGKYVYIDLWATWCNPCKQEIPHLKEVEEKYHGKNIEFVSISVDREKDYNAWKKMIVDKKMTGTQLYAKGDRSFMNAYRVSGIPRFILLDPEGNIVDANAPRPSDPNLVKLFDSLSI